MRKKHYYQISVQEIIDLANIGRTTFYAHFETKDYLLKTLCEELFGHIIDIINSHYHYFSDCKQDNIFLHLLLHLQENDRNILALLSSQNNEIFLRYFKDNLNELIKQQYTEKTMLLSSKIPQDYLINHISTTFAETIKWWLTRGMNETPQQITKYFLAVIDPIIKE